MSSRNNKSSRRNNNKRPRRVTKRSRKRSQRNGEQRLVIYKQPGRFCPDRLIANLRWTSNSYTRSAAASTPVLNWAIRSSGYDPDPGVLTGSIPGFVELANMYRMYKVHRMRTRIEVTNGESEPVVFIVWPSSVLHNVNSLSRDDVAEFSNNVLGKSFTLGMYASVSTKVITDTANGNSLIGPIFKTDLDYAADTSSNPTLMFGFNYAAFKHDSNFVYPLRNTCHVTYTIEFFERRALET